MTYLDSLRKSFPSCSSFGCEIVPSAKTLDGSHVCRKHYELWRQEVNADGGNIDAPSEEKANDAVDHPKHYIEHPSGIECITITEHMGFTLGNVIKYVWRADMKGGVEDLKKARWYIEREISKREKED